MSSSTFCCAQPQQRIDSPEPPARRLAAIDGIFAAAILPEDHPHALKFSEKKAEPNLDIVQSPSISSKIKLQFRRTSMKSLKKEKEYDADARQMTLREVLDDVNAAVDEHVEDGLVKGNSTDMPADLGLHSDASAPRPSSYLSATLRESSDSEITRATHNVAEIAARVAARPHLVDIPSSNHRPLTVLPKSTSSPNLLSNGSVVYAKPQRSCSELAPTEELRVLKRRSATELDGTQSTSASSTGPIMPPTAETTTTTDHQLGEGPLALEIEENRHTIEEDNVQLHKMDISHQLRSMSQMSDFAFKEALPTPAQSWTFHRRERSDLGLLTRNDQHSRQMSNSRMEGSAVSRALGRVRTPFRDTSPSIYSRPASAEVSVRGCKTSVDGAQEDIAPLDLHALFADWPLKHISTLEASNEALTAKPPTPATEELSDHGDGSSGAQDSNESRTVSFDFAAIKADPASARLLSPSPRAASIHGKDSCSILTKSSKASRFLERFSPPRKLVQKRRSIFKFLRPGSRKQQARSISSPALHAAASRSASSYDGNADDPALLTIEYELAEHPHRATRSASMNQLAVPGQQDSALHLTPLPHHALQRQPTLADYERSLSVVGDDRRRPSAVNIERAKEMEEEHRRESVGGLRKRISRARPLRDDASPLMAQALEKHQQEKALFRSSSKQRDFANDRRPTIVMEEPSSYGRAGASLPPASIRDHNDLLDPLEKGYLKSPSERGVEHFLVPPRASFSLPSQSASPMLSARAPSTVISSFSQPVQISLEPKKRIGTNLESWSRYPSYNRAERCGSAALADDVFVRDFAVNINPDEIQADDEHDHETTSPRSKKTDNSSSHRSKSSVPNSRNTTFSNIVRYYSNLFQTRGWGGQNRRTSITTGGSLEYPELEMLPPQLPTESLPQHRESHPFHHLKEQVKEDADKIKAFVKDEEDKFGQLVKKEEEEIGSFVRKGEDELQSFVQTEEHKLADFVKKEEGRIKHFVKEEEGKMWHRRSPSSHSSGSRNKGSPFRTGSIFVAPSHRSEEYHTPRSGTPISPEEDDIGPGQHDGTDPRLRLDGMSMPRSVEDKSTLSKAQVWSALYQDCLARSFSAESKYKPQQRPVSALNPVKPRHPDKNLKPLDPEATIRRFPSVTVIDDRKGHLRSVSLISIKTSRSMGFERSSTHDLLELIKIRERDEREKLLNSGIGLTTGVQVE